MLHQAQGGFAQHKQYLSEIHAPLTNSVVAYFLTAISNRLEPHVTAEEFTNNARQSLQGMRADGNHLLANIAELSFCPWSYGWSEAIGEALTCCIVRPLIDRYDRVIKVLSCAVASELTVQQRNRFLRILNDLFEAIGDPEIRNLLFLVNLTDLEAIEDTLTDSHVHALDLFYEGRFEECIEVTSRFIYDDPTCFSGYWLLGKAIACSSERREVPLPPGSIACVIASSIVELCENRNNIEVVATSLKRTALKLGDNHLGLSLWQLVCQETDGRSDVQALRQAIVRGRMHPAAATLEWDHPLSGPVSDIVIRDPRYTSSQLACFVADPDATQLPPRLTRSVHAIATAIKASETGQHTQVLRALEPLRSGVGGDANERAFHMLFFAYLDFSALLGNEQTEEAAASVVNHYCENPQSLRHVPFHLIIESVATGRWEHMRLTPYWPILVLLNNGDAQDIYEAVDDYLIYRGFFSPAVLIEGNYEIPHEALRVLLRDVLILPVIARGALWCRTAEERRNLRTKLLQRLFAISVADQEFVVDELSSLEHGRILEEAYRNVEGPKFFLDAPELKKTLATALSGAYERYVEYRTYEEAGGHLPSESELLELAKSGEAIKHRKERAETSDQLISSISTYTFLEYLWDSQWGINATLSNRIRHGALENQLKRSLGAYGLLGTLTTEGGHRCDPTTQARIDAAPESVKETLQGAFATFTTAIASLYNRLMSDLLRIRVPAHVYALAEKQGLPVRELVGEKGLIDFSGLFSEETLSRVKQLPTTGVSAVIAELQRIFSENARDAFKRVQVYFATIAAEEVDDALRTLEHTLEAVLQDGGVRATLRGAVLSARNEFAIDLRAIQKWFAPAAQIDSGIGTLDQLIETASRVISFASNGKLGSVYRRVFQDRALSPEIGVAWYEVLSIVLRNVVQHSGVEVGQEVVIEHREVGGGFHELHVTNKVADSLRAANSALGAKNAVNRPMDARTLDRGGGTGLFRVRSLLRQCGSESVSISCEAEEMPPSFTVRVKY